MTSSVFLSHNSRDKPEVERLARDLLRRGIRPWLDKWNLTPGRSWQTEIEQAIREASAVLVCFGRHELGRVQHPEMEVAQDRAWRDPTRLVIPVLLASARESVEVPDFLRQRSWVDLRGEEAEAEFERLVATLEGRELGPPAVVVGDCPYPGLAAFDEDDAPRFFGREKAVVEVLTRLRGGSRLLTLVGASGAGKSSLMLAGVLPALRTGEMDGTYDWSIVRLRPGPRPLHELAVRLTTSLEGGSRDLVELRDELLDSPETLGNTADLLLASRSSKARIVVAVDQFEEVFTLVDDAAERRAFLDNLLHAATVPGGRVTVLLTLRADFLGRALEESLDLASAIKDSQEVVLPMSADELRSAIERPAWIAGLRFDEGLVATLVHEVEGQPGDLPLLQFTLQGLFREREDDRLSWTAYRRLGELRGAIAQEAETFLASLDDEQVEVVRRILGRLVRLGEGTSDTRRRAPHEELQGLSPRAGSLLDHLVRERFLTASEHGVELAHEALLSEWTTLRRWIEDDREALRLQHLGSRAATQWDGEGRSSEDLWRGSRLARAREALEHGEVALSDLEQEFLEASLADEEATRLEEETRRQRELESAQQLAEARLQSTRRLRWGLAVALVLVVAVGGLAIWAFRAQAKAEASEQQALENLRRAVEVADLITFKIDRDLEDIPGTAKLRTELLEAGQELLQRLSAGGGEAEQETTRRSQMVLHGQRGDVAQSHEDLQGALSEYRAAFALATELVDSDPANRVFQNDLSVSHERIGDVLRAQGDLDAALREFRAGFEIAQRLSDQDPGNASWLRDLSVSNNKIGDVLSAQGDLDAALSEFRAGFEIAQRLSDQDPGNASWLRDLSVSHDRIGDVLRAQGNLGEALREFRAAFEIAQRLSDQDPGNASWLRDLSVSNNKIGDVMNAQGVLDAALREFRAGFEIRKRLSDQDPGNASWLRDLSVSHYKIGDVLRAQGDLDAALREFRAGFEIAQRLSDQDPGNASWLRDLSVSHNKIGDVLRAQGDLDAALREFRAGFEIAQRLSDQDPGNASWQWDLAVSCWRIAHSVDRTTAAGRTEAISVMEQGLDVLRRLEAAGRLAPTQKAWLGRFEDALAGFQTERTETLGPVRPRHSDRKKMEPPPGRRSGGGS